MFHYRLASSSNQSRMLIAVFLAIALHMGLMNFEFEPKPVFVPSVSLPRSVSIFLQQNSIVQTPDQPVNKTQNIRSGEEEQLRAEKELEIPATPEIPAIIDKPVSSLQSPALLAERVKQPVEIAPAYQKAEDIAENLKPEAGETVKVQEFATKAESQAVQEKEGAVLPGTFQMAYPRYQLNTPPTYPGLARKRGQEGTVILQVLVNREGRVDDLKIDTSSNSTLLDRAAVTAVRKWTFEPGRRGEERVPMWVRVPVTFKLKK